jgi:hypothetical protein
MQKSKNMLETPEYLRNLALFVEIFREIENKSLEAGKLLVMLCKTNENTLDILEERHGCSRVALDRILKVGQGSLDKRLVLATSPAALIISRYPIKVQKDILDHSAAIKVRDERTAEGCKTKALGELTPREAQRALSAQGIVPVEKQSTTPAQVKVLPRYRIEADGVRVISNTLLTWDTLRAILEKHDRTAMVGLEKSMKAQQVAAKR